MKASLLIPTIACIAVVSAAMLFCAPAHAAPQATLTLNFKHYVGNEVLKLDSAVYRNEVGQPYTVSKFKYYISHIELKNKNGGLVKLNGCYLINEDEPESQKIELQHVPKGEYSSISFILGVDSLHNCNGAQSGALDPINAMFWTWNTGYIFMKVEGHSSASTSPGNIYEFHIGGYKAPANCIRTISLNFGSTNLQVDGNSPAAIDIKTDVAEIFKHPVTVDFSKLSSVTDFHNATTIADNYTDMFSILSIH